MFDALVSTFRPGPLAAVVALAACSAGDGDGSTARANLDATAPGGVKLVYEIAATENGDPTSAAAEVVEVIVRRLEGADLDDVAVAEREDGRILVRVERFDTLDLVKTLIGVRAELTFHVVASDDPSVIRSVLDDAIALEPGQRLLPTREPSEPYLLVETALTDAAAPVEADGQLSSALTGRHVRRTSPGVHPQTGEPIVNFAFDAEGAALFGTLTSEHIGERIAVAIDGEVVTAPMIMTPITGGAGFIEGGFTVEEAALLATVLNAGALPAPLILIEERLGARSPAEGRSVRFARAANADAAVG
jgi:preprotein translocase subunit SecD